MSWNTFHRRGETLRTVVEAANDRRDGVLPMAEPGVAENFADELDLLGALQLKWHARLSGNVERALMREPMDLESAVSSAWRATAEELAGVRLVIDRCAEQPTGPDMAVASARAARLERARLAMAAGLASGHGDAAVEVGRRIEDRARAALSTGPLTVPAAETPLQPGTEPAAEPAAKTGGDTPGRHVGGDSFVERIKAALTAA